MPDEPSGGAGWLHRMFSNLSVATPAPTAIQELRAVIATVDKLATCTAAIARMVENVSNKLPGILTRLAKEAAEDNIFVRAVPKTAAQVAVQHAQAPDGPRSWWVVYIGREPGIYPTLEDADLQIKGCPNQQYRRKGSKKEALAYYKLLHEANEVEKMSEDGRAALSRELDL
ncbi:hypothetical protein B0H19DRAFT_1061823 [Mycena capillaripes]|nr:hypothetical protein B0H19DRAFT_1061823 [Mycena capillaripes]